MFSFIRSKIKKNFYNKFKQPEKMLNKNRKSEENDQEVRRKDL